MYIYIINKLKIMTLMAKYINSTQATLMAALSTLSPQNLSLLTHSISAFFHHHRHRLITILSSPILFSLSLRHLHSLSLHQKSLLLARHLHSSLLLLHHHFTSRNNSAPPPPPSTTLRDLDATLLLLLLCELNVQDPKSLKIPPSRWRASLTRHLFNSIFSMSQLGGFSDSQILIEYVESVTRCWNFVGMVYCGGGDVAAAAEAVVALPWVEVSGDEGDKCVICREDMRRGIQVCELPCGHLFHWSCILRWFKKTNTCPCCRHRLPTADVCRDTERIMENLRRVGECERLRTC